jgi:hypothetical protein
VFVFVFQNKQDTLLGAKLITQRDTFIGKDLMMNILMNIMDWDGTVPMPTILKPEPLWTGKQVGLRPMFGACSSRWSVAFWYCCFPLWVGLHFSRLLKYLSEPLCASKQVGLLPHAWRCFYMSTTAPVSRPLLL